MGFDILAPVLAKFPNIGQIFVHFSGHAVFNFTFSDTKNIFMNLFSLGHQTFVTILTVAVVS